MSSRGVAPERLQHQGAGLRAGALLLFWTRESAP